jgi:hypothetical protein
MYDKWETVDAWMRSPAFEALPEGSLVLAPTLFEHYPGTSYVGDEYWSRYVLHHGRKPIEIVHFESDWREKARAPGASDRLYYLRVVQQPRERASYLVFSRVAAAREGAPLVSGDVSILMHVRSEHLRVIGRLADADPQCRARMVVDGVPSSGTFVEYFAAHVDRVRDADEWRWARVASDGALMLPESIVVSNSSEPVDGSVDLIFDRGFHADEVAHRWADRYATLVLRNSAGRDLQVELLFEAKAPGVKPGEPARLEASAGSVRQEWAIGSEPERRTLRVAVPALSSVPVTFSTDAPAIEAPLDPRTLVVMFHQGMRVQEMGCDAVSPEGPPFE